MDEGARKWTFAGIAGWIALAALLAVLGTALHSTLGEVVYHHQSDEGYYLRYMRAISDGGLAAFPSLFRFYLEEPDAWIHPPPSRMALVAISAAWSKVFGVSMHSLSLLSLASFLGTVALVYAFSKRWFSTGKSLLVTLLVAFSPLYLGLARTALSDSFSILTQVAAIFLFLDYVREPQRTGRAVAACLAFSLTILAKEIAVLLAIPFFVHAAIERWHLRRDIPILRTAWVLALPGFLAVGVWVLAAGGPKTLYALMEIVMLSPATNKFAVDFGSGSWFRYPIDEILMSPWPTLLGLGGAAVALWRWRSGEYDPVAVAMVSVYVFQVGVLGLFTKNLRYVAVLEVPLRLLAVAMLWDFFGAGRRRLGLLVCTLVVLYLCWTGWSDYQLFFLRWKMWGPVTTLLGYIRDMVPVDVIKAMGQGKF